MEKGRRYSQAYNDPLGFCSNRNTLKDARKLDPSISPYDEYQVELFFLDDLPDQDYKVALLMVDVFTRYTEAIPLKDKTEGSLLSGLMEGFHENES